MANEMTVIVGLTGAKNGMNIASGTRSQQRTMNGANMVATSQLINGTSGTGTLLALDTLANVSEILIVNQDNTAAVNIGTPANMATVWCQVGPNSAILFQPPASTNTVYALSHNASNVNVAFYASEV